MSGADGHLVGFTAVGPSPVGVAHMPAEVGVSVMYGKNGAGKTRLLQSMRASLRGQASDEGRVFLHWVVPHPEEMYGGWRESLNKSLAHAYQDDRGWQLAELLRRRDANYGSEMAEWQRANISRLFDRLQEEDFSPTTLTEVIANRFRDIVELFEMDLNASPGLGDLAGAVALSGCLVFEGVGAPDKPAWAVYSALDMSNEQCRSQVGLDFEHIAGFRRMVERSRRGEISNQEALDYVLEGGQPPRSNIPWEPVDEDDDGHGGPLMHAVVDCGLEHWPAYASVPLHRLATIQHLPIGVVADDETDVDGLTRNFLASLAGGQVIEAMDGEEVLISKLLATSATLLQDRANRVVRRVLPQAPILSFELTDPNSWFTGELPSWSAVVPDGRLALDQLSQAESKWARVAISLATSAERDDVSTALVLLDEPEQGLHGHAEARLAKALADVSRDLQCIVVAATHSAALLNAPSAAKHHLSARAGTQARSLRLLDRDLLRSFHDVQYGEEEVGLSPAEILHMIRLFLIVEGPHDKLVLGHLLADDIAEAGAVILHTAGARNLPELTRAQLIWDYTDADVLVVLDGIAARDVMPAWEEAKRAAQAGDVTRAHRALLPLERLPGGEPGWLRELLGRALTTGHWERLQPHPLSMPDIVCYLPPDALGLTLGWDDLIKSWRESFKGRAPVDLKGWLRQNRGAKVGMRALEKAVEHAVPVREIQDLGVEIRVRAGMREVEAEGSTSGAELTSG